MCKRVSIVTEVSLPSAQARITDDEESR